MESIHYFDSGNIRKKVMTSLKENPSGISHRYNLGDKEFNSVKNFDGVLCANLDAKILRSKFTRNETKK